MRLQLSKLYRRIEGFSPRAEDVQGVLINQVGRIKLRAALGRDVAGFPFLRKRDGSPSHLYKTGNLLRSLQAKSVEGPGGLTGRISVTGRALDYAALVNAKRRFMGASVDDRRLMIGELRQALSDRRRGQ